MFGLPKAESGHPQKGASMSSWLSLCLNELKGYGFNPSFILDIGAYKGKWTAEASTIFPHSGFFLIEANPHPELEGLNHDHLITLLSDTEREVDFYQNGGTGDSYLKETTSHFKDREPIRRKAKTLDSVVGDLRLTTDNESVNEKGFDLIKIDCQGAEIDILKGGEKTVSLCDVLILEAPFAGTYNKGAPSFAEYIAYVDKIGFTPFEFAGFTRWRDITFQVDIAFIRKESDVLKKINGKIKDFGK